MVFRCFSINLLVASFWYSLERKYRAQIANIIGSILRTPTPKLYGIEHLSHLSTATYMKPIIVMAKDTSIYTRSHSLMQHIISNKRVENNNNILCTKAIILFASRTNRDKSLWAMHDIGGNNI